MKKIIAFLIVLFCVTYFHMARANVEILPVCLMHGPLYLEIHEPNIQGMIGLDAVSLMKDGQHITGTIKGQNVELTIYRGYVVMGYVGETHVRWRINERGDAIYGYQNCIVE